MRKIHNRIIRLISRSLVIWYRFFGPPRVLRHSSGTNQAILSMFGAQIGATNVRVYSPITLHGAQDGYANLIIEDGCVINGNNYLDLHARVILKQGASLGPGVIIMTHNSYNGNKFLLESMVHTCGEKDVVIEPGAGIKAGALVTMGVTVGENAVVAGNAVVNRNVEANCFVAGVPARVLKRF